MEKKIILQMSPKKLKSYFKVLNNIFGDLYIEHYEELFNMIKFKRQDIKYDTKYEIDNSSEILKALKGTNINELFELFCLKMMLNIK